MSTALLARSTSRSVSGPADTICDGCGLAMPKCEPLEPVKASCPFDHSDCFPSASRRWENNSGDPIDLSALAFSAARAWEAGWQIGHKPGTTLCPACQEKPWTEDRG